MEYGGGRGMGRGSRVVEKMEGVKERKSGGDGEWGE